MDDKESLERLLEESPVPPAVVLQYLSHRHSSHVSGIASIKLFDLYLKELAKTTEPQRMSQLQQIIVQEAEVILNGADRIPVEEVIRIGCIAVEQLALANDWEKIRYPILIQSKRPEVASYAIEMALRYEVPEVVQRLKAYHALFDGRPSDAVHIAAEAEDIDTLRSLSLYIPQQGNDRAFLEEKMWYFAKQGKLPLEEALSLAKLRGVSLPAFAEALLATIENPMWKAIIAKQYAIGDLGVYILECVAELRGELNSLRGQLQGNPTQVAKQLDDLWKWGQVKNYLTHPEQSRQMDLAINEGYALETDALILTGQFEKAITSASISNHPKKEWLLDVGRLAKNY